MDQVKIGRFIAECRKREDLTQMQLAEKLNITDRAISKWERGKAMPDSSIMLPLCKILKISVNELLSGERVANENNDKNLEDNLIKMIKEKEEGDKRLLLAEILIGVLAILPMLFASAFVAFTGMTEWIALIIIFSGMIPLIIVLPFLIKIEQIAGYYECECCQHKYVPSYKAVFMSPHIGRKRKMICPMCKSKCWHKKVTHK